MRWMRSRYSATEILPPRKRAHGSVSDAASRAMRSAGGPDFSTRSMVRWAAASVIFRTWLRRWRASGISFSASAFRRESRRKRSSALRRLLVSDESCAKRSTSGVRSVPGVGCWRAALSVITPSSGRNGPALQDLVDLFLERLRRERLDHIPVNTRLRGFHDLLALGFRREHEH